MRAWMSDRLYMKGVSPQEARILLRHFSTVNPKYQQVLRFSATGGRYTQVPKRLYAGCYDEEEKLLTLPRAVLLPEDAGIDRRWFSIDVEDRRSRSKAVFPSPRKDLCLNLLQQSVEKRLLRHRDNVAYLLKAGTAFGKTIAMLNMARVLKQKTLILTHRTLIFRAWMKDLHKMFGESISVGKVVGPTCVIGDHYTVAMLQTLHCRKYPSEWYEQFGTVVMDECHNAPQPFITGVVDKCPCLYRIGGTATIDRSSRSQFLFWMFGKPFYSSSDTKMVKSNQISISEMNLVWTKFEYEPEEGKPIDVHDMTETLFRNKERNKLIVNTVLRGDYAEGKTVLVTTSRKAHCRILAKRFAAEGVTPIVLTGDRLQGVKQADREVSEIIQGKHRLLIATEQLIREGVNIPSLDRLHVAIPIGKRTNFEQLCGRICRVSEGTGKTDAKVTIYFDVQAVSIRKRVTHNMIPVLRKLGVPNAQNTFMA